MKANLKEQYNLKIEPALKADIVFLDGVGVDVPELVRVLLRKAVKQAKEKFEKEAS